MCIWAHFNDDQAFLETISSDEAKKYKRSRNNQLGSCLLLQTKFIIIFEGIVPSAQCLDRILFEIF